MPQQEGLDRYLAAIGETGLLGKQEECRLCEDGYAGRMVLVERNLRLVVAVAKRFRGHGMDLDDLIQIGNIALMAAARNFNPRRGRFSTYAFYAIEQALSRATAEQGGFGHIPETLGKLGRQARRLWSQMAQELGREPTLEEIAKRLGVSLEQLQIYERVHRLAASLEALVFERNGGGDGPHWKDVVADQFPSVDAAVIGSVFGEEVWSVVERMLPAKELRVLELRFGRGGGEIRTLKQVGEVIGASYEWVRKLEQRALQRLRDSPKFAHFDI